jgi:hypothetical protein
MDAPAVAVSADGKRIAVAWMDQRTGNNQRDVWWRVAKDGKFGAEASLHEKADGLQAHPALAVDAKGVVHAAWEDGREGPTRVMYATSEKKENVALSGGGRAGFPSLACGPDFVVAVWEQDGVKAKVLGK